MQSALFSQLRQLVDGRVELEVWREEFRSAWVDEAVRLSDRNVGDASNISDFCGDITDHTLSYYNLKHDGLIQNMATWSFFEFIIS